MKKILFSLVSAFLFLPVISMAHGDEVSGDGSFHMMDWHWGNGGGMMGSGGTFGVLALLTWIVWLGVGVLAIVWLLKNINKDK